MRIPMTLLVLLLGASLPGAVAAPHDPRSVSDANGAIELFCVDTLGNGQVDRGCCEATTIFLPGWISVIHFEVQVQLAGATAGGISGVEFYLDGMEGLSDDWGCWVAESYASVSVGRPSRPSDHDGDGVSDARFVIFAWPNASDGFACESGDGTYVPVARLAIGHYAQPTVDLPTTELRVVAGSPSSRPGLRCPLVTLCDDPVFTAVCVGGGSFVINGEVPAPVSPSPADASRGARPIGLTLEWKNPAFTTCGGETQDIYLGTDPDPGLVQTEFSRTTFDAPPLQPRTTYYWRVARETLSGTAASPVWSFTTGDIVAVDAATWSRVKELYR